MINYANISKSLEFYEENGFTRIEVPWTVSQAVSAITKPKHCIDYVLNHNGKTLVASGEQSFLYLYLKNHLPKGKFQAVTPCFRDETFDVLHSKYFIKNELIDTQDVSESNLMDIVGIARDFFSLFIGKDKIAVVETKEGFDIMCVTGGKQIELGSYGIRSCEFLDWVYATGCAEPRLSDVIRIVKNEK
jgi:hypothetical protein